MKIDERLGLYVNEAYDEEYNQRAKILHDAINSLMSSAKKDQKASHEKHINMYYKRALDQLDLLRTYVDASVAMRK